MGGAHVQSGFARVGREAERQILRRWVRRADTAQALALRCRTVLVPLMPVDPAMATWLGIAAGHGGEGVSPCSWLIVLDGPSNEAAAGELLVIGDENVERVILKNLEEKPTISSQPVNSVRRRHTNIAIVDQRLAGVSGQPARDTRLPVVARALFIERGSARPSDVCRGTGHRRELASPRVGSLRLGASPDRLCP